MFNRSKWQPDWKGLIKGPFILHRNCVAVLIYRLHLCRITAFQFKTNLTFMRHRSAVTPHECAVRQCNAITVKYERTLRKANLFGRNSHSPSRRAEREKCVIDLPKQLSTGFLPIAAHAPISAHDHPSYF